ncbi:hypothetical protein TrCOL_g4359 [Triparma columacea]|uniref:Vacuolar protein 8 n=1 Tax=Triparma columacea TaxID=722753 RepID=A0A9W7GGA7_9STRA|nr:hypothetical protein TrCOL_g4359 [Triparma columacea]
MDKLDALVEDLTGGDVGKVTAAAKSIVALAEDENNQKKLFDYKGIVSGLLEVVKKGDGTYKEAREKALGLRYKVARKKAIKAIQIITIDNLDALVMDLTREDVGKVTDAAKSIVALAEDENNQKKLFDYKGIVSGLLEVVKKGDGTYKEAREKALEGMKNMARDFDVRKGMFELDGLMESLLEVVGKEDEEYKIAREKALAAIVNIAFGGVDVKKGMFELDGLMKSLLEVVGKEGEEYKVARENALAAIWNISSGGADVQKRMFELDGLMKSLLEVVGKEEEEYKDAREKAIKAIQNIFMDHLDALVVDLTGEDVGKVTAAAKSIVALAEDKNNQKKLFQFKGIVSGLLEVVKKEDGAYKEAREKALEGMKNMARDFDVRKGMFELDGLMKSLLEIVGKEGEEYKVAREKALMAIGNIALGGADVDKGMLELDGLMKSLLEVVRKEEVEYKVAREKALAAIWNISFGGADVKKGMLELDGLMKSLLEVVGKEGEEYKVARENALAAIWNISSGGADVQKRMFELDGLMESLLEVVGKEGEEYKVAREYALAAIQNISTGGADVKKGMFELDGLMKSLLEVVGKEGEEYKVARENALGAIVNIATGGAEVQFGLATFPSLLPTLLQYATKDSPSPECRRKSVWALSKIARNPSTAPLLLTPKDSTVDILACVIEIIKEADEDLEKWDTNNGIEFESLEFLMNVAQAEFAVPYLRVAGVAKVLAPLVKQNHLNSLMAAATVAYLVGGDEEGELFDLLSDNKHAIDRIVELLDNTLNLKGWNLKGDKNGYYEYGVFPLHSSVRAIKILSKSDNFKDYLLSKNCFALLHRTLSQFITDTNAGRAGGGAADVESAALAVEALHELSYPSPTSSTSALDIVTRKVDSNLGSLTDLLSDYKDRSSVKSSKEYASSTSTATALIDRISLLANEIKVKKAVAAMKRRQSIAPTPTSEHPADADEDAGVSEELVKAKEALERNLANAKEKARLLEEKIAQTANEKDARIVELERKLAAAEAAKHKSREDIMQAQLNELMALTKGLHTKTDTVMSDLKEIKNTVSTTLSSLQNFYTGESDVPRYILVIPFVKKTESTGEKVSRFFSSPKKFFLSEPTAKLVILCSYDFSAVVEFEIEEPRQFVKDHAATIQMTLKGLRMMSQAANVGAKILTGASLPFDLPSTESFDSFLDAADGMVEGALELAGDEGSEEREAIRRINDQDGGGDVEAIKKVVGSAYRKLKDFLLQEGEGRMDEIRGEMEKVRGSDGKEEWVSKDNLDAFHKERQSVEKVLSKSGSVEKLREQVTVDSPRYATGDDDGLADLLEKMKKKAKEDWKANPVAKKLFKALSKKGGDDYQIVLSVLEGEAFSDVDARYEEVLEMLED